MLGFSFEVFGFETGEETQGRILLVKNRSVRHGGIKLNVKKVSILEKKISTVKALRFSDIRVDQLRLMWKK